MARKGSNKLKCKAYRDSRIREINKKRKITKHLKDHPADKNSLQALENLKAA